MKNVIKFLGITALLAVIVFAAAGDDFRPGMIEMVPIPAGRFTMGMGERNINTPSVTLSAFYMGKYEVTQEQYQAVMGSNPSHFKTAVDGESGTPGKLPVENVSWYDALVFCNKLSVMEGLGPAYSINGSTDPSVWGAVPTSSNATWDAVTIVSGSNGYRLPTEAQWEYACRAGTANSYSPVDTMDNIMWHSGNSESKTHQVGLKRANAWGLYDMHGNVAEWCWDWYGDYARGAQTNPSGASSGTNRVARGGNLFFASGFARSANRGQPIPDLRDPGFGFRLVRPNQ